MSTLLAAAQALTRTPERALGELVPGTLAKVRGTRHAEQVRSPIGDVLCVHGSVEIVATRGPGSSRRPRVLHEARELELRNGSDAVTVLSRGGIVLGGRRSDEEIGPRRLVRAALHDFATAHGVETRTVVGNRYRNLSLRFTERTLADGDEVQVVGLVVTHGFDPRRSRGAAYREHASRLALGAPASGPLVIFATSPGE